jgi:FkbH-like protein
MDVSKFLFPTELAITTTNIKKVLLIGSCLTESYFNYFGNMLPKIHFEWIPFNNIAELPEKDSDEILGYDAQYIQLPLRSVVSDEIINFGAFIELQAGDGWLASAKQMLAAMLEASLAYNTKASLLTFVSNFSVPQAPVAGALDQTGTQRDFSYIVQKLNDELARLVSTKSNVYLADVNSIGNSLGKRFFLDDVISFYSHASCWNYENAQHDVMMVENSNHLARIEPIPRLEDVYALDFDQMMRAIWRQIESLYRTVHQIDAVKLVIFDLDDTLWRGQAAEHYGENGPWPMEHGWPVGMWEAVQHLRSRGIITAICSKNDENLVRSRWRRCVPLPWLDLEDFPLREINWRPKSENIARIIANASLTPKSVVFVDDNPVERESVKAALPEIRVIGSNPYETRRILLWSPETQIATRSAESKAREQSIRTMQVREADRAAMTRAEFLQALGCVVRLDELHSIEASDFTRAFELLNKTNQFNTTGKRWNASEMRAFVERNGKIFTFTVRDKYTNYGLVGVVLLEKGVFEQFAMSCRVLGLEIETSVINFILAHERRLDPNAGFAARVVETPTNMVCRDVFLKCGFRACEEGGDALQKFEGEVGDVASHLEIEDAIGGPAVAQISEPAE